MQVVFSLPEGKGRGSKDGWYVQPTLLNDMFESHAERRRNGCWPFAVLRLSPF